MQTRAADRVLGLGVGLLLLAVGGLAWFVTLRPALAVDPAPLAALPAELAGWQADDIPVGDEVESMLRADFHVNRAYRHRVGGLVWLYVGYYGTERGGRPEHLPATCYEAQGWQVIASRDVELAPGLSARELRVERDGRARLVHYWFQSHESPGITDGLALSLHHLRQRLAGGRADGALVRLSTPIDTDDAVGARTRLVDLGARLGPLLARHWPDEHPAAGG